MEDGQPADLVHMAGHTYRAGWVYETDHLHERVHIWLGVMPDGRRWWVHHTGARHEGPDRIYPDEAAARRGVQRLAADLVGARHPGVWWQMDPVTFQVRRHTGGGGVAGPGGG